MSTQTTRQEQLFGERDTDHGTLTVENGRLYPFLRVQRALVDEAKLHLTPDGIDVQAVDPANVGMVSASLDCDHDLADVTAGTNVKRLAGICQNKPRDVDLHIDVAMPWGTVRIEEQYANDRVWNVTERFGFIDPDSIRSEPDLPDLEFGATTHVHVNRLSSFLQNTRKDTPEIELGVTDGTFRIAERADTTEYLKLAETDIDVDGEGKAFYSGGYLKDIFKALKSVGVEQARLSWGDKYPIRIEFTAEHMSGEYFVAPRIQSG